MSEQVEYVAVADGNKMAGAAVWWRLSGDTDLSKLHDAWENANLPGKLLPPFPSLPRALAHAVGDVKEKRLFPRSLPGERGWALVREIVEGPKVLRHSTELMIEVADRQKGQLLFTPDDHLMVPQVIEKTNYHLEHMSTGEMGAWMAHTVIQSLFGVPLRDTGGFYFVPQPGMEMYELVTETVKSASGHSFYSLPTMHTEKAVEAILASVMEEANAEAESMEKDIASAADELGNRARKTRQRRCGDMLEKLAQYERLLNVSLDDMRNRVENLQAVLTGSQIVDLSREIA